MLRMGNPFISGTVQIDSPSLSAEELAHILGRLVDTKKAVQAGWQFSHLVQALDEVAKVNPHQHITGSVGGRDLLKWVIQVYQQDPEAREAFLDYVDKHHIAPINGQKGFFHQSDDALLRWFERQIPLPGDPADFQEADDRLNLTRLAFQSRHEDSTALLREAYRAVALENLAHGVTEVWFRTSLGDHEYGSFISAAQAAVQGARQAELDADTPLRVRFLVGMRKRRPGNVTDPCHAIGNDTKATELVTAIARLPQIIPGAGTVITGIDSVGMDSDWRPQWQSPARSIAAQSGLRVAIHFGESWREGALLPTLQRLEDLVRYGLIHQLDNANALFAAKDPNKQRQIYSESEWREAGQLQRRIFELLSARGVTLGINPTSNDLLTRSLRQREGWRFRELNEPLGQDAPPVADLIFPQEHQARPLLMVVGNDNSRLYPSRIAGAFLTVSEELANLWKAPGSSGVSVYGKLPTRVIARLILNGFALRNNSSAAEYAN